VYVLDRVLQPVVLSVDGVLCSTLLLIDQSVSQICYFYIRLRLRELGEKLEPSTGHAREALPTA
jgi:hypothetical protein